MGSRRFRRRRAVPLWIALALGSPACQTPAESPSPPSQTGSTSTADETEEAPAVLDPNDVAALIEAMRSDDPGLRSRAVDGLVAIGRPATKTLVQHLDDEQVRHYVLVAMSRIHDPEAVPPLVAAYSRASVESRGPIAQTVQEISPEAYGAGLGALENERIEDELERDPKGATYLAGPHAKLYAPGKVLLRLALGNPDPQVRKIALGQLLGNDLSAEGLLPELESELENPSHEREAEEVLESLGSNEASSAVDAHFRKRFERLMGIDYQQLAAEAVGVSPDLPKPRMAQMPVSWKAEPIASRILVEVDDSTAIRTLKETTLVSREGVSHLTLSYVKANCTGPCGAALVQCRPVLVYRTGLDRGKLSEPLFLFSGTLDLEPFRTVEFQPASTKEPGCRNGRFLDFEKTECGIEATDSGRTARLTYRDETILSTFMDYSSGGTADMPFGVTYRAATYFLFDGQSKFERISGWLSTARGKLEVAKTFEQQGGICDGGGMVMAVPRPLPALDTGAGWYAVVEREGETWVKRADARGELLDEADRKEGSWRTLFLVSHDLQEGPVMTPRFDPNCGLDPRGSGWPAGPGGSCRVSLGSERYRFELVEPAVAPGASSYPALSLQLWREGPTPIHQEVLSVPPQELWAVQLVFAGDLNRDGWLDLLVARADPPKSSRRYDLMLSGYGGFVQVDTDVSFEPDR